MIISSDSNKWQCWLILFCSAGLIAIWPMPGTIALRHIFLGLGFLASLSYIFTNSKSILCCYAWPFWLFTAFYCWLIMHLAFFANEPGLQFAELKNLWFRALLATPLGLSLGLLLNERSTTPSQNRRIGASDIFTSLSLPILLIAFTGTFILFIVRYAYEVYISHQLIHFPFFAVPYKAKTPFVIAGVLSLPLCFILIARSLRGLMSKWWIVVALFGIAFALFGVYFANTKNGMAILSVCLTLFIANFLLSLHWTFKKILLGIPVVSIVLLMSTYGIYQHLKVNHAWPNLLADIKVSKNIDRVTWWKNDRVCCIPVNSNAIPVDVSTYQRTAWFVAGSELLIENPLGYGLVHHSFGALARLKWNDFVEPIGNMRGATHSAWLDFALGVGIPGLLLVLIPLWVSWYRALFQEGLWFSYASWTIPIMTLAYLTTETNEAHFIELLFYMTAFFCGLTIQKQSRCV